MADLSITAAQVDAGTGTDAKFKYGIAAVAITAGQSVYLNSSGQWALADCDAGATEAAARGVAVCDAAAGQQVCVQTQGLMTLGAGAAPTVGLPYFVSDTAGGIKPAADLGSGDYMTILGVGASSNQLKLRPWASGVAQA